jgi:hypothetical protein
MKPDFQGRRALINGKFDPRNLVLVLFLFVSTDFVGEVAVCI